MVRQRVMIPLRVMTDQQHVGPIFLLEDIAQLALGVPLGRDIVLPLDAGAVQLETRIADIGFGRQLVERVFGIVVRIPGR